MFGWFKRKAQLAIVKSADEDISRFILGLRGVEPGALSMVVAVASHWRNVFAREGIDLLDPMDAAAKDHFIGLKINRVIKEVQRSDPRLAAGLMVWLHTIRASTIPEVRLQGRQMWEELSKGFDGMVEAGEEYTLATSKVLLLDSAPQVPLGLEPLVR